MFQPDVPDGIWAQPYPTPLTVLNIEDDTSSYLLLSMAVSETGKSVVLHRARDGEDALEFLQRSGRHSDAPRPSLIILDINMPKMSGIELLAKLSVDPILCSIPVVMLTTSASDVDRCMQLGAKAYFVKPMDYSAFVEVTRSAIALAA